MYDIAKEYKEMIYVALSWILTLAKSLVVQWANGRNDLCCLSWILTLAKSLAVQWANGRNDLCCLKLDSDFG